MNRKDLAKEVSDFIEQNVGDNDTDDVELGVAAAQIEEFVNELDEDDSKDEEGGEDA
jgi:hypothetical protein